MYVHEIECDGRIVASSHYTASTPQPIRLDDLVVPGEECPSLGGDALVELVVGHRVDVQDQVVLRYVRLG